MCLRSRRGTGANALANASHIGIHNSAQVGEDGDDGDGDGDDGGDCGDDDEKEIFSSSEKRQPLNCGAGKMLNRMGQWLQRKAFS